MIILCRLSFVKQPFKYIPMIILCQLSFVRTLSISALVQRFISSKQLGLFIPLPQQNVNNQEVSNCPEKTISHDHVQHISLLCVRLFGTSSMMGVTPVVCSLSTMNSVIGVSIPSPVFADTAK
jgi:hypothetical protein